MTNIPLRDYIREIDNMIEHGQIEQAIAHCRHVLKYFPKHLETYRLLGKAFLELQQLGDAADIFQRVLSSIPDDFVSHIGMSIIREDEGNLDAAIWHMERAYEVQSSNIHIQDELRRLYGRRDGQEPHKIRLTRGALARLYANGHLYSQAIAELHAALAADPRRLDLQALLAKMYHQDNQVANAAKTASQLIVKLPYCLIANQILVDILENSRRQSEANVYRERIYELDPYYQHISPQYPNLEAVPSGLILVEMLDWEASKAGITTQPAWAASLGVDLSSTPVEEELPDWFSSPPQQTATEEGDFDEIPDVFSSLSEPAFDDASDWTSDQLPDLPLDELSSEDSAMQDDDNIPEWMKDAGWTARDPNQPEEPPSPLFEEEEEMETDAEESGVVKAEIPDWLQALAPKEITDEDAPSPESPPAGDLPDWLQDLSASDTAPSRVTASPESSADLPAWLQEDAETEPSAKEDPNATFPEWQTDEEPDIAPTDLGDLPDWLQETAVRDGVTDLNFDQEALPAETAVPDWLQEMADDKLPPEEEKAVPDEPQPAGAAPETPAWLNQLAEDEEPETGVTAWLSALESGASASGQQETPSTEQVPDWLQDLGQDIPETGELAALDEASFAAPAEEEASGAFRIDELSGEPLPAEDINEDDAMAWLESLAAKQGANEEELLTSPGERSEILPEWLQELTEEAEPTASSEEEEIVPEWLRATSSDSDEAFDLMELEETLISPADEADADLMQAEELAAEAGLGELALDMDNEDAAMAWLESLAAKQGAKEEELLTAPEARQEDIPEWLQAMLAEEPTGEDLQSPTLEEPVSEAGLAAALEEIAPEELATHDAALDAELDWAVEPAEAEADEAAPEFGLLEDEEELEESEPLQAEPEAEIGEDQTLDWLETLAAGQEIEDETLAAEEAATPEAELELEADLAEAEMEAAELEEDQEPLAATTDEAPDWLAEVFQEEDLAIPHPPGEGVPAWLTESAEEWISKMQTETAEAQEEALLQPAEAEAPALEEPAEAELEFQEEIPAMEVGEFEEEAAPAEAADAQPVPTTWEESLTLARNTLNTGQLSTSIEYYERLINSGQNLDEVIADITEALNTRFPVDIGLWITLGDAYVKKNSLQEALDSYTKAEELLR